MSEGLEELREAHDQLAELYAAHLADHLASAPVDRAVLDLFAELVTQGRVDGSAPQVADIGCGTGRLAPYLARHGFEVSGVDLSPEMIRVARREQPGLEFAVADLRALPYADAGLSGAVAWYSLMYLPPGQRADAYAELARVVRPGGHLVTAFKLGDDRHRRGGARVGVAFDIWWMSVDEVERRLTDAGFVVRFRATRPAEPDEEQAQAYVIAQRG
ncbi:methyltransferase family protein [Barrientosiimonas humi]|uniref:Methyltransferase family protein n=1 Tax=Barrientosiimonas humi TaxID=999931 RepID=A0A542XFY4_9MICO|nr:methyltransferase domain-containing protein [Barrientosiimonas humi]TQL34736.1 methyltransferase family protein [Barrientosiimonas humi]CAG7570784.1 2-methyl-6-phytyl-1,4-hydroquinone methyltransferase [Barrientosiimonas humi]